MTTIKVRGGTAAQWASANPVLAAREPGVETDTGVYKVGDGSTTWASLNPVLNSTYAQVVALTGTGIDQTGATDSTTAINTLLTASAGKVVRGVPGASYLISAPLVVKSGTALNMTGCTVTLASGSNCNMVQNTAVVTANRTVTDGAITTGTATLTSATAAFTSADTGRSVTVAGAVGGGAAASALSATMTYVNATTVTLSASATASVTGATVTIYDRDTGVTVSGGTWVRGSNDGTLATDKHSFRFRRVDRLTVRDVRMTSTGGKFAISIGDCADYLISDVSLNTASDGVHVGGACFRGRIRNISGTTSDDTVSVTPRDYVGYDDCVGDVLDLVVENVTGVGSLPQVKVLGGANCQTRQVRVRNITGNIASGAGGVWVGDDSTSANCVGGLVDDVTVENLAITAASQAILLINGTNMGRIRAKGIHSDTSTSNTPKLVTVSPGSAGTIASILLEDLTLYSGGASTNPLININGNATIAKLMIDRVAVVGATQATHILATNGIITDLDVRNVQATFTGGSNVVVLQGSTASVSRLTLNGIHVTGTGGSIVNAAVSTQTLPNVEITGGECTGMSWVADLATTTELHLAGVSALLLANGFVNVRATGVVTLRGEGILLSGSKAPVVAGGGVLNARSFGIPLDVSLLTKTAGDMAYNTASGTLPGVGPAVCDGTTWRSPYTAATKTAAVTLSGGTVTVSDAAITANSIIRLAYKTIGGTPGAVYVSAKSASTSFTITSTSGTDTSVIQYYIDSY